MILCAISLVTEPCLQTFWQYSPSYWVVMEAYTFVRFVYLSLCIRLRLWNRQWLNISLCVIVADQWFDVYFLMGFVATGFLIPAPLGIHMWAGWLGFDPSTYSVTIATNCTGLFSNDWRSLRESTTYRTLCSSDFISGTKAILTSACVHAMEFEYATRGGSRVCVTSSANLCLDAMGYSPGNASRFINKSTVLFTYIYKGISKPYPLLLYISLYSLSNNLSHCISQCVTAIWEMCLWYTGWDVRYISERSYNYETICRGFKTVRYHDIIRRLIVWCIKSMRSLNSLILILFIIQDGLVPTMADDVFVTHEDKASAVIIGIDLA